MRIAVATFDDETISAHFRQSDRFAVFDVTGGEMESLGARELESAPHSHDHGEGHAHNHQSAIDLLADCCTVICGGMGARVAEALSRYGIEPVVAANCEQTPETAARTFADGTLQRGAIHACCCGH